MTSTRWTRAPPLPGRRAAAAAALSATATAITPGAAAAAAVGCRPWEGEDEEDEEEEGGERSESVAAEDEEHEEEDGTRGRERGEEEEEEAIVTTTTDRAPEWAEEAGSFIPLTHSLTHSFVRSFVPFPSLPFPSALDSTGALYRNRRGTDETWCVLYVRGQDILSQTCEPCTYAPYVRSVLVHNFSPTTDVRVFTDVSESVETGAPADE